jgi:hypothetical protein
VDRAKKPAGNRKQNTPSFSGHLLWHSMLIVGITVIGYAFIKPSPPTAQSPPSQPQNQPRAQKMTDFIS